MNYGVPPHHECRAVGANVDRRASLRAVHRGDLEGWCSLEMRRPGKLEISICKLCRNAAGMVRSHIIPDAFNRDLKGDSGGSPVELPTHPAPGRTVPLNAEGRAFFGKLAVERRADELLFERMGRVRITRHMRAASKTAGLESSVVFHDLRRSYGSLLLNKGVPADHIQELLGHADARMTRRHYAHLMEASLQKSLHKLPSFSDEAVRPRVRK